MTALELIEQTGSLNNYIKVLTEWSMIVMKAHGGRLETPKKCKMYMHMSLEEYIMNHSQYKPRKKYKPREKVALNQLDRNKLFHMRKLAVSGYYSEEINTYISERDSRDIMSSTVWKQTNSRARYDRSSRNSKSTIS